MRTIIASIITLVAGLTLAGFASILNAAPTDPTPHQPGDFWIQGHYAEEGDPGITRLCGLMLRRNYVEVGNVIEFDYTIFWSSDTADPIPVRQRQGRGEIKLDSRDRSVDWIDDLGPPDGQLYLQGEGSWLSPTFWTGKLWDADFENRNPAGMRTTQFWVVPLNPGDTLPPCW